MREQTATGSAVPPSLSVRGMAGGVPVQSQSQSQSKTDPHRHRYLHDLLHALHLR
jgi:hypothetical protein